MRENTLPHIQHTASSQTSEMREGEEPEKLPPTRAGFIELSSGINGGLQGLFCAGKVKITMLSDPKHSKRLEVGATCNMTATSN